MTGLILNLRKCACIRARGPEKYRSELWRSWRTLLTCHGASHMALFRVATFWGSFAGCAPHLHRPRSGLSLSAAPGVLYVSMFYDTISIETKMSEPDRSRSHEEISRNLWSSTRALTTISDFSPVLELLDAHDTLESSHSVLEHTLPETYLGQQHTISMLVSWPYVYELHEKLWNIFCDISTLVRLFVLCSSSVLGMSSSESDCTKLSN